MSKRILLVGGGSGGHVFPLLAVVESLQKMAAQRGSSVELILLGEGKFFEEAAKKSGLRYKKIMAGKMRRYFSLLNMLDLPKILIGLVQSFWHLFWLMPDVIFTKGGYASVPPAIAAKFFLIPLYVHDSDTIPGAANRWLGKLAKKVFVSFEMAKQYFPTGKTELTGNPVRQEILNGDRNQALQFFKLSDQLPTILVLGGSQGAQKINEAIIQSALKLTSKFQIIHQTGDSNYSEVQKSSEQLINYHSYPFLDSANLSLAYAAADVIISRAGANFLSEISALSKPAIVIPIKRSAANHQYYNAVEFSKYGAVIIEEDNLVPSVLIDQVEKAYQNRMEIVQKIKDFASPDAADKIAAELLI
ncbi:MAG: undecaprenyldiphospho-muramoylpentapeptide beta-N-acetylglucosaminyltransferase [Candidatus Yanofskybacteria bacterium RIFCSPLOWO2_02_FULL_43_10b]|uniref:UDP-N-acetylglucosamine--N-acetylmuramyl-(pentapeptide) pyrophosphoryl-undecaprenol N-acetylglucosamine transferase n=1 Tax=Candidatus Yanofskybacteria bacterium RIFCSPLOWO2_02_FULL_43_10b TaxID=1802704 RepID=A0A1F8H732_9BACT|nr:MAG: undecaprenyldiphospho-muramoylpentapeptide beta-N-acetylglucosaminyltransferase [Candidatus Yanofskybacteria bacterium RIFCSPLOWO2_02_FULL_43_10b]